MLVNLTERDIELIRIGIDTGLQESQLPEHEGDMWYEDLQRLIKKLGIKFD